MYNKRMNTLAKEFEDMSLADFRVVVDSTDTLRKLLLLVNDLIEDVNMMFTEDGVRIQTMDSSHVCLTSVNVDKVHFKEYVMKQQVNIGIKLSNIIRVLACMENETVAFEYHEEFPDEFVIRSKTNHVRLKTIDIDSEEMEIPDMDVDVEIDADAGTIQKYLKNIASFGDTIRFYTDNNDVNMSTTGDIGSVIMNIHDQNVKISGSLSASFSTRFLVTFAKAANISKRVLIKLVNENPVVLEYEFDKNSWIRFFLAPKITDEDDE